VPGPCRRNVASFAIARDFLRARRRARASLASLAARRSSNRARRSRWDARGDDIRRELAPPRRLWHLGNRADDVDASLGAVGSRTRLSARATPRARVARVARDAAFVESRAPLATRRARRRYPSRTRASAASLAPRQPVDVDRHVDDHVFFFSHPPKHLSVAVAGSFTRS